MSCHMSYHGLVYFSSSEQLYFFIKLIGAVISSEHFMNILGRFCSFPLYLYYSFDIRRINFLIEIYDFLTVCWRCFACIICSLACRTFCLLWTIWLGRLSLFFNYLLSLNLLSATTICLHLKLLSAILFSNVFLICSFFLLILFICTFSFCMLELSVFH